MLRPLLRTALPLAARRGLKTAIRRTSRNAAAGLIAALFLLAALVFALVALYSALLQTQLDTPTAAGIMAAGLAVAAGLVIAVLRLRNRREARRATAAPNLENAEETIAALDRQTARLMRQIGPAGLLIAAFAVGLGAGRRTGSSGGGND